jgi:hypothetical protein
MKKQKLVMVGNGMAGVRTLEELRKLAPDLYDITVFGAEPHPNYNRILLSPVLAGEMTIQDIILNARTGTPTTASRCTWASTVTEDRPSEPLGGRHRKAPRWTTTACCWPPAPRPSCRPFRARTCRA